MPARQRRWCKAKKWAAFVLTLNGVRGLEDMIQRKQNLGSFFSLMKDAIDHTRRKRDIRREEEDLAPLLSPLTQATPPLKAPLLLGKDTGRNTRGNTNLPRRNIIISPRNLERKGSQRDLRNGTLHTQPDTAKTRRLPHLTGTLIPQNLNHVGLALTAVVFASQTDSKKGSEDEKANGNGKEDKTE